MSGRPPRRCTAHLIRGRNRLRAAARTPGKTDRRRRPSDDGEQWYPVNTEGGFDSIFTALHPELPPRCRKSAGRGVDGWSRCRPGRHPRPARCRASTAGSTFAGDLRSGGEAAGVMAGVDWTLRDWAAGLMVSHSRDGAATGVHPARAIAHADRYLPLRVLPDDEPGDAGGRHGLRRGRADAGGRGAVRGGRGPLDGVGANALEVGIEATARTGPRPQAFREGHERVDRPDRSTVRHVHRRPASAAA